MEGILLKQKELERQLTENKKYRNSLLKKLNEGETGVESRVISLREKSKDLDSEIR